uniref:Zinc transporter 2 n=2 Tax=Macrostomum lignano TaxID=282301 RepID=A0A1I8I250_9PLAT
ANRAGSSLSDVSPLLQQESSAVAAAEDDPDSHCHELEFDATVAAEQRSAQRRLLLASVLCLLFMAGEIVGGALANSLAIMTDAAHLLTDFASFMISLLAIFLAGRRPSKTYSFGWHRAEVLGALVSVLLIWLVTGILVFLAIERVRTGSFDVDGRIMLITSAVGVAVNILMAFTLHPHSHSHEAESADAPAEQNINVRAAFIHVIGDLLQSLGVLCAAYLIYYRPDWRVADPICTFLFSVLVLITTFAIIRDALRVLMEAAPRGLDFDSVTAALNAVEGVVRVHSLRIWSISVSRTALSAHLAVADTADSQRVLQAATLVVRRRFRVHEVTVQVERMAARGSAAADCSQCHDPAEV